jgi:hypothetical protein
MALASAFPAGPQARVRPGARSVGEAGDQPGRAHQLGQAAKESADLAGDQPGRAQELGWAQGGWPIWQEISWAHVGRAAWGRTGRSRTMGRTARQTPPEGTGPDKGRGPSTHEMEGPIRSSGARHSYLMLSVRTTRSTTKPETRLKTQLPSSPCVRGAPRMVPFSAVRDFYAYLVLPHKRFRPAISRFFGRPPIVHSSAQVIPQLTRFLHMKSTGEPDTRFRAGCSAARRTRMRRRPPFRWPCYPAPSPRNLTPSPRN